MDTQHPQGEGLMELLLAVLASSIILTAGRSLFTRDAVIAGRIAALRASDPVGSTSGGPVFMGRWARLLPGDRQAAGRALKDSGLVHLKPEMFVASRYLGAVVLGILAMQLGTASIVLVPIGAAGGYRLPDLYLKVRMKARTDQLRSDLPDVIDLLCVCVQAGLNISLSLKRVAAASAGVLGDELRRVVQQIDLGIPRKAALEELAARHQLDDLDALVATLVNAERFGTGVSSGLQVLSSDLRSKRRRRAEEEARRAPVKILFPLVFLILPAFILLTVVPLLLGTFEGLGF